MRRKSKLPEGCMFWWFVSFGWVFFFGGLLVMFASLEGFTGDSITFTPLHGVGALLFGLFSVAVGIWPILYERWREGGKTSQRKQSLQQAANFIERCGPIDFAKFSQLSKMMNAPLLPGETEERRARDLWENFKASGQLEFRNGTYYLSEEDREDWRKSIYQQLSEEPKTQQTQSMLLNPALIIGGLVAMVILGILATRNVPSPPGTAPSLFQQTYTFTSEPLSSQSTQMGVEITTYSDSAAGPNGQVLLEVIAAGKAIDIGFDLNYESGDYAASVCSVCISSKVEFHTSQEIPTGNYVIETDNIGLDPISISKQPGHTTKVRITGLGLLEVVGASEVSVFRFDEEYALASAYPDNRGIAEIPLAEGIYEVFVFDATRIQTSYPVEIKAGQRERLTAGE